MKVVLFCGGFGLRLRPTTTYLPKPLVPIRGKPIVFLLMKYYAYFGHKDFILCLGYKGDKIREFFSTNGASLSNESERLRPFKSDIEDWKITFVDTGLESNIGQRLKAVQKYLDDEELFLANYADGLTDMYLPKMISYSMKRGKIACLIAVRPSISIHVLSTTVDGYVKSVRSVYQTPLRINGGYFIFKNQIFDYIKDGEDLVEEPFERLIKKRELVAYKYNGFWAALDTFKDKQRIEKFASNSGPLWEILDSRREQLS
jgi:glucose-1-phosphate cytidylyltransferase